MHNLIAVVMNTINFSYFFSVYKAILENCEVNGTLISELFF